MSVFFMDFDMAPSVIWARDLYDQMQIRSDFRKWFPRMCQYGFVEGRDYEFVPRVRPQDEGGRTVQRYVKDYRITLEMAKQLYKLHHFHKNECFRSCEGQHCMGTDHWMQAVIELLHQHKCKSHAPPKRFYESQPPDSLVTTTQIAKEYGCGAKVFNRLLHLHGIQYRANNQWVLYAKHQDKGYIQAQPGWVFVGIYADEGISGTSLEHRKGMQQLIEDCKAGKIDLVLTKSIARFARNIVDCLSVIELLKNLNPPVGVKFEADNIYTLDSNGRMILTILASVAEEESHSKSIIMNWSIDRRFSRGLFLTPALLGYDKDEEGNLVINPEEAQTVKVIYYLYLNGYSLTEIATLLMEYSRKTKLGRVEWNPGTLAGVLANERHCGDVLARKTFTPNFLTHKSKKNNNDRTQYRQKNHHEAIVSREVFNAANHLRASRNYSKKDRPLPVLSVVEDGILRGYVPFDKDWTGFSAEEYREASESVMKEPDVTVTADVKKSLDLTGYEIVRVQYFSTMQNPAMTISNGRLRFNTACLKKFENVEYVELLLNSVERCIAIRPCDKNNPNAIRWGRLKEGRWCASTLGCRGLAKTLFDIMEWDEDLRYRFRGQFLEQGDNKMMLFAFDEPEMIKVEEIVLPPKENTEEDEGETVKKKIYIFPPEWAGTFGQPITSIAQVGILRQEHYAGNWDVFRPATEIEEMNIFTAESLNELLREAEKIMEGWTDYR